MSCFYVCHRVFYDDLILYDSTVYFCNQELITYYGISYVAIKKLEIR